jgi:hypothetical protein
MTDDRREKPAESRPLLCSRCGVALERGRGECYFVEVRTVADPSSPVFSPEDLERDTERAIGELLARLRAMTERQLLDQVYSRRLFCLCAPCHARWVNDPFGPC